MKASPFDNVNYFFDGIMFSLPANGYILKPVTAEKVQTELLKLG